MTSRLLSHALNALAGRSRSHATRRTLANIADRLHTSTSTPLPSIVLPISLPAAVADRAYMVATDLPPRTFAVTITVPPPVVDVERKTVKKPRKAKAK